MAVAVVFGAVMLVAGNVGSKQLCVLGSKSEATSSDAVVLPKNESVSKKLDSE